MKVVLSPRARDDLRQIQTYIAYEKVSAAARVATRLSMKAARAINNNPNRKDHLSGSRDRSRKRGANNSALTYHCLACVSLLSASV
jgi:plasmid stabilization system protein ParE